MIDTAIDVLTNGEPIANVGMLDLLLGIVDPDKKKEDEETEAGEELLHYDGPEAVFDERYNNAVDIAADLRESYNTRPAVSTEDEFLGLFSDLSMHEPIEYVPETPTAATILYDDPIHYIKPQEEPTPQIKTNPKENDNEYPVTNDETVVDNASTDSDDNDASDNDTTTADTVGSSSNNENTKVHNNNGFGNGDQDAPGNSLENNNAENAIDKVLKPKESKEIDFNNISEVAEDDKSRKDKPKDDKHDNNGFGNGDQDAPGNSLLNNNAENAVEIIIHDM